MDTKPFFPFRSILIPVFPDCDPAPAIAAARAITAQGRITLVGIVPAASEEALSAAALPARQTRASLQAHADGNLVRFRSKVRVSTEPWQEIVDMVEAEEPDLLLLHWPDAFEAMGVSLQSALERPPCDVVLVSGSMPRDPKNVLLALRGGPYAELALRLAMGIQETTNANLTSLHIQKPDSNTPTEAGFKGLETVLDSLPDITQQEITTDDPVKAIIQEAGKHDLLVMGSSAVLPSGSLSLGTIADAVSANSSLGVLVVKSQRPVPIGALTEFAGQRAISVLVDRWFAENTYHANEFANLAYLLDLKRKQNTTISLALPALNEQETVGQVIHTVKSALMDDVPLLDEIVLIDSNSTDHTREIAAGYGIPVYIHQQMLPEHGARRGKGEALWKSLLVTRGDIILWIDTDISNIDPRFVYGLIGPLLLNARIQLVKGFYRRPLRTGSRLQESGGGRVTELTARPLLNLFYPELSGLVQPLSGEYGGRREALEQMRFFSGYGVEIGLLIDILERYGLLAIAQVDLQERIHHNQPLESLSKMSFAIIQAVISRLERRYGRAMLEDVNRTMKMIRYDDDRLQLEVEEIAELDRPPMVEVAEYRKLRAAPA